MQLVNTSSRYGAVSQTIHWVTAALVIILIVSGKAGDIEPEESNALYYWHSSLGLLVLPLVVARIAWRFVTPPPPLPQSASSITNRLARSVHATFYALLLALPLSGWLAASAEGGPVTFFGVILPRWEIPVAGSRASAASEHEDERGGAREDERGGAHEDERGGAREDERGGARGDEREGARGEATEEFFEETHEVLGNVLLILITLHVLAALKHHFVDKDDILRRMLPTSTRSGDTPTGHDTHAPQGTGRTP